MGYIENYIYEIIPVGSHRVIKSCAKCGGKSYFVNTDSFRVNANGNKLDVWLIYQCNKCKYTYNLSIYERISKTEIKKDELEKFMSNDIGLAKLYGNKKELFVKNKAEIDYENIEYRINIINSNTAGSSDLIEIRNPYGIKVRTDKVLSEILQLPRSTVKQLLKEGRISDIPGFLAEKTEISYQKFQSKI